MTKDTNSERIFGRVSKDIKKKAKIAATEADMNLEDWVARAIERYLEASDHKVISLRSSGR